jgi:hypothetical protein
LCHPLEQFLAHDLEVFVFDVWIVSVGGQLGDLRVLDAEAFFEANLGCCLLRAKTRENIRADLNSYSLAKVVTCFEHLDGDSPISELLVDIQPGSTHHFVNLIVLEGVEEAFFD